VRATRAHDTTTRHRETRATRAFPNKFNFFSAAAAAAAAAAVVMVVLALEKKI